MPPSLAPRGSLAAKGKTPKKSLEAVFEEAAKTKASEKQAKAEARAAKAKAKAADNDAKAEARAELLSADKAELKGKAAPAKAAPEPPKGLLTFQKRIKAQTAARAEAEKGRAAYFDVMGRAPVAPEVLGLGRFLGRFCN